MSAPELRRLTFAECAAGGVEPVRFVLRGGGRGTRRPAARGRLRPRPRPANRKRRLTVRRRPERRRRVHRARSRRPERPPPLPGRAARPAGIAASGRLNASRPPGSRAPFFAQRNRDRRYPRTDAPAPAAPQRAARTRLRSGPPGRPAPATLDGRPPRRAAGLPLSRPGPAAAGLVGACRPRHRADSVRPPGRRGRPLLRRAWRHAGRTGVVPGRVPRPRRRAAAKVVISASGPRRGVTPELPAPPHPSRGIA